MMIDEMVMMMDDDVDGWQQLKGRDALIIVWLSLVVLCSSFGLVARDDAAVDH